MREYYFIMSQRMNTRYVYLENRNIRHMRNYKRRKHNIQNIQNIMHNIEDIIKIYMIYSNTELKWNFQLTWFPFQY